MVKVLIASTPRRRKDAFAVRIAVFVEEQQIPPDEELDELDAVAVHCVGYDGGTPVAAGRLLLADGYAKIGRMAVIAAYRRTGIGARVLEALEQEGIARGVRHFKLSAQLHARSFYERCGYEAVGDVYGEVDIPHIAMEKLMRVVGGRE